MGSSESTRCIGKATNDCTQHRQAGPIFKLRPELDSRSQMRRFWWVNHNQTARQEIEGQFLWSPKTERNGARSEFYNNMRRASPGDLILSYARQAVGHVGRVAEFAFSAPKPAEFGSAGANWDKDGWHLPVFWTSLTPPVRPRDLLAELRPLLPDKYSPIRPSTGEGNQKAYLAEIPDSVFSTVVENSVFDEDKLARGGSNSLTFRAIVEALDDIAQREISIDPDLSSTTKEILIQARRGQGRFRANVEAIDHSCRMTGVSNPSLLIASHIKPWRLCESPEERLDGMNGLMLTPDADLLFDRGFISFNGDGEVLVSSRIDRDDLRRLGFDQFVWQHFGFSKEPESWHTHGFYDPQYEYLDFHRSEIFVS